MKESCFYTIFDDTFRQVGQDCVNSVRRFYPNIPIITYESPKLNGRFDLKTFCDFHLQKGMELLDEYQRVIYIDSDSIMCDYCDELFGDFSLGVVQNNIYVPDPRSDLQYSIYINAGLDSCIDKIIWQKYIDEYNRRCSLGWEELHEQNALNFVYHTNLGTCKLLEFDDKLYGISDMEYYPDILLGTDGLYIKNKKLKVIHFAGGEWKDKSTGRIRFELIKNDSSRNYLINLMK